jgi:hypothetical protein
MTIKFLKDYSVGTPPEHFEAGQKVEGRSAESEAHFVRRGVAAYVGEKGVLTDIDGNVVVEKAAKPTFEKGDPKPQKASSQPADKPQVLTTSADVKPKA